MASLPVTPNSTGNPPLPEVLTSVKLDSLGNEGVLEILNQQLIMARKYSGDPDKVLIIKKMIAALKKSSEKLAAATTECEKLKQENVPLKQLIKKKKDSIKKLDQKIEKRKQQTEAEKEKLDSRKLKRDQLKTRFTKTIKPLIPQNEGENSSNVDTVLESLAEIEKNRLQHVETELQRTNRTCKKLMEESKETRKMLLNQADADNRDIGTALEALAFSNDQIEEEEQQQVVKGQQQEDASKNEKGTEENKENDEEKDSQTNPQDDDDDDTMNNSINKKLPENQPISPVQGQSVDISLSQVTPIRSILKRRNDDSKKHGKEKSVQFSTSLIKDVWVVERYIADLPEDDESEEENEKMEDEEMDSSYEENPKSRVQFGNGLPVTGPSPPKPKPKPMHQGLEFIQDRESQIPISAFPQDPQPKMIKRHDIASGPPPEFAAKFSGIEKLAEKFWCTCGIGCKNIKCLRKHILTKRLGKIFRCKEPNCNAKFSLHGSLKAHLIKNHDKLESEINPFGCRNCGNTFLTCKDLRDHRIEKHNFLNADKVGGGGDDDDSSADENLTCEEREFLELSDSDDDDLSVNGNFD